MQGCLCFCLCGAHGREQQNHDRLGFFSATKLRDVWYTQHTFRSFKKNLMNKVIDVTAHRHLPQRQKKMQTLRKTQGHWSISHVCAPKYKYCKMYAEYFGLVDQK